MDVLLVSLTRDLMEIRALIESAGHRIVEEIVQVRDRPQPRTFVGKGKLGAIRDRIAQGGVDVAVFNGEFRPTMHYHLERELKVECYDRLRVLLELFAQRAATREAKLQVELALLQYEVPLLREWIHRAETGERPGFLSGGEYRVDAYYETVKRRIKKIRDELERIRSERRFRRAHRKDRGYGLVAIAGYANAGKSSLLNALAGERLLVDDRMFSTLSTTTRALRAVRTRVLLTDTVGFVDGVPFWMVEAFNATLEEIVEADLILLLVDSSDPDQEILRKVRLAARTLLPRVDGDRVLPVLTKVDRLDARQLEERISLLDQTEFHRPPLATSTRTGVGLEATTDAILATFAFPLEIQMVIPQDAASGAKLHWLYEHADVIAALHRTDRVEVLVRCRLEDRAAVEALGTVVAAREVSP